MRMHNTNLPLSNRLKSFLAIPRSQYLRFKNVTKNEKKTNSKLLRTLAAYEVRLSEPHRTRHGDREIPYHLCIFKIFWNLTFNFTSRGAENLWRKCTPYFLTHIILKPLKRIKFVSLAAHKHSKFNNIA